LVWLTIQWLVTIPLAAALSYLLFSDVHGLPTGGFYILSALIIGIATAGYAVAVRTVLSWRESS
jgi:hypothetical protein